MKKITMEQYEYLLPMNEKYGKWLDDKITAMRIYKPFAHLFEEIYYCIYKRDGEWRIISERYDESMDGILKLVKEKAVVLTDSTSSDHFKFSYLNSSYQFSDKLRITSAAVEDTIFKKSMTTDNWQTDVHIITEFIEKLHLNEDEILRVYMLNAEGDNPKVGDVFLVRASTQLAKQSVELGKVVDWIKMSGADEFINFGEVEEELVKLCLYTPQLEFFAVDIIPTANSFKIVRMDSSPPYPKCDEAFGAEINNYLHIRFEDKKNNFSQAEYEKEQEKISKKVGQVNARYPEGFYPDPESTLFTGCLTDFEAALSKESWAYERGFFAHRLEQYGINALNQKNFISDFEYEYLGQINNKYRTWFEDKITIKYILNDFGGCMPAYYYLITLKNGKNKIVSLMDCPRGYKANYADVFRLVREKGALALKPDEGTHGAGFFKFTYVDGTYYLNGKETAEEKVMAFLSDVNNQYLITEFIQQHPDLARIYPGSVNTARLTVFKKDGKTAQIGNGYVRFGTSETGGVDNIGAGGIGADLDISTGYYSNGVRIRNGVNGEPCPDHPDTGVLIEGYLPNWEDVVEVILKIAESLPEIEYMGFDVAFTEDGIKLPEINRFPDFPKINKLTLATMDYLLYKLDKKKKKYGYADKAGEGNLIKLSRG